MSSKEQNLRKKRIASEKEKGEFTTGILSVLGEKFKRKEIGYVFLKDFLLEQGINVCEYPSNYALPEYVTKVEETFREIWWEMLAKKQRPPYKKVAYIKGFLLGVLIKSKQVHEDFCDLQDNLSEIESIETAKAMVQNDSYYLTDCTDGMNQELASAYLDGQLDMAKKCSFKSDEEEKISEDIERINELVYEVEELCNGTHKMYKKSFRN